MECVLSIVDQGTELQAVVATRSGSVIGRATMVGSSNPRFITGHAFRRRLQAIVSDASSGLDGAECRLVLAALPAASEQLREQLAELVPIERERIVVAPIERCALAGCAATVGAKRAIVVRADISSRGWGVGSDGREVTCSGFGEVLGDEGSAYWIGRKGLRAALKAFEKRSRNTLLRPMVMEHYGVESYLDIVGSDQHGSILTRDAIASFTPSVFEAARSDDRVALEILEEGGRELAIIALAIVNELDLIDSAFQVLPYGSVFRHRGPLLEMFVKTLKNKTAKAALVQEGLGPIAGGVLLAIDELGIKVTTEIADALRSTLRARA